MGIGGPGPIPRVGTRDRPTHAPGTTTPCTHHGSLLHAWCSTLSEADSGSPGFFWLQWGPLNTNFVKTATSFWSKKRPVKNDTFREKAYLIVIVFTENAIFDVFAEKPLILTFSETPLFPLVFHCFATLRFCLGKVQKVQNISNFQINLQK